MPEVVVHIGASNTQTAFLRAALARSRSLDPSGPVRSVPSLAGAGPDEVERFLSAGVGHPSRVVLVVRDLQRQLPLLWAQQVLDGGTATFAEFVTGLDHDRQGDRPRWQALDAVGLLAPWASRLGSQSVHVVTVPPAPGSLASLWQRFAVACVVDPTDLDVGVLEASVVESSSRGPMDDVVGDWTSVDVALWSDPRIARWSADVRDGLSRAGYVVHGDLGDLAPEPGSAADEVQLDAAVDALRSLVQLVAGPPAAAPATAPATVAAAVAETETAIAAKRLARSLRHRLRGAP